MDERFPPYYPHADPTVDNTDAIGPSCTLGAYGYVKPRVPLGTPPPRDRGLRVAIVVPFVARQLDKIDRAMQFWTSHAPCQARVTGGSVTVVVVYDRDLESADGARVKRTLMRFWRDNIERPGFASCFGDDRQGVPPVEFLSSRLDPTYGHIEGAAAMFFGLFPLLEQRFHAFFLAESDCLPVQPNWVNNLVSEASMLGCDGYGHWQRGSAPQHHPSFGQLTLRGDFHINGNALYLLGCADFEEYMCRAQSFYPPFLPDCPRVAGCATGQGGEQGYDHVLFHFRRQPRQLTYTRHVLERFSYTQFVKNLGEEPYNALEVVKESNDQTFFVHSKAAHFSDAQTQLTQAYLDARSRYPTKTEVERQYITLRSHETTKKAIAVKLCQKLVRDFRRMPRYQENDDPPNKKDTVPREMVDLGLLGPKAAALLETSARFHAALSSFHSATPEQREDMLPPVCRGVKARVTGVSDPWTELVPHERAYVWTVDFDARPTACNLPLLVEQGAAVHAEVSR